MSLKNLPGKWKLKTKTSFYEVYEHPSKLKLIIDMYPFPAKNEILFIVEWVDKYNRCGIIAETKNFKEAEEKAVKFMEKDYLKVLNDTWNENKNI